MSSILLNEHDANQGAQSSGEFLGMTGNSGWYLLGSGGATIMMVIFLWGVLGVSLLLCLFVGILLCLGSLVYVFTLKNNKPEQYDTDFFESALVEAGLLSFRFGPRERQLTNPFTEDVVSSEPIAKRHSRSPARKAAPENRSPSRVQKAPGTARVPDEESAKTSRERPEPTVAKAEYEQLQEKLSTTEDMLEEALVEVSEN
jgi:hypothetical protein